MEDIGLSELELKVICAGNCIACGKPINLVMHRADNKTPDIFFCKTCMEKVTKNEQKTDKEIFEKTDSQTPIR